MSLHGVNALYSESWMDENSSLLLIPSDSYEEAVMFTCSLCKLEFEGTKAVLSEFDDSVQCPNCGNWE